MAVSSERVAARATLAFSRGSTSSTAVAPRADDGGVTGDGGAEGTADVINEGVVDGAGRRMTLVGVSDANWRDIADVAPRDDQRDFVPPSAARYLLLSQREDVWHSLGVHADDSIVGHVMWGWDDDDQMHWIGGLMVDAGEQGRGVGRAAMVTLIRWLFAKPNVTAVRLSYQPESVAVRAMYVDLGFVESDVPVEDEIMAELTAARAAALL